MVKGWRKLSRNCNPWRQDSAQARKEDLQATKGGGCNVEEESSSKVLSGVFRLMEEELILMARVLVAIIHHKPLYEEEDIRDFPSDGGRIVIADYMEMSSYCVGNGVRPFSGVHPLMWLPTSWVVFTKTLVECNMMAFFFFVGFEVQILKMKFFNLQFWRPRFLLRNPVWVYFSQNNL